jgi:rhomboid protease GluP
MLDSIKVRENWLTRSPNPRATPLTLVLTVILYLASLIFFTNAFQSQSWMSASADAVFTHHEYWRAWTALFAHSDPLHLVSNLFLFIPLAYWLIGYFNIWFFPIAGFFIMGLLNMVVLKTMPPQVQLLGASGVVYWMGAAWLTLFLLIDRRHTLKHRVAAAISLVLILLVPETYTPEVSYFSHLLGFAAGAPSALALYVLERKKFEAAEVKEYIYDTDHEPAPAVVAQYDLF